MPDPTTPEAAILHHERMAKLYDDDVAALEARYGTGTRPGWVSDDIAIAAAKAAQHRAQAAMWRERLQAGAV